MDNLVSTNGYQLPVNIEDLSKFVLVGREKLISVKAEIRAIDKIGFAKEVREQKREEAHMLAEALLDAEARIGELLKEIPKASGGKPFHTSNTAVTSKPKESVIKEMGFTKMQVSRFETLADNLDVIEQVKAEAIEKEELPTRTEVLRRVQKNTKPHVVNNSGNNEWYTPKEYIEIARKVMGSIDCDPASSVVANTIVQAKTFDSEHDNGLNQTWQGNVWMNPPYAQPFIKLFADKLIQELDKGNIKQACVLVNNATETNWFQTMAQRANAIWFIKGRIKYLDNTGTPANTPLQGQCILYYGDNTNRFKQNCGGLVCEV
jgi:hypothetical protein